MSNAKVCPVCNSNDTAEMHRRAEQGYSTFIRADASMPVTEFNLAYCRSCQFLFNLSAYTNPDFSSTMENVYSNYQLMTHFSTDTFPLRDHRIEYELEYLSQKVDFSAIESVLEVGSNRGDFLYLLKKKYPHINVLGVETAILDFTGVPTIHGDFFQIDFSNKFDLILSRHVIEHLHDPVGMVKKMRSHLQANGKIYLEVPNIEVDLQNRIEPFIVEHIGYYNARSITALGERAGMYPIEIRDENPYPLMCLFGREPGQFKSAQTPGKVNELITMYLDYTRSYAEAMKKEIRDGKKLVFFGAGNVFLAVYSHLRYLIGDELMKSGSKLILDDSPAKKGMEIFGLPVKEFTEVKKLRENDVIYIIATMNPAAMGKMEEKLRSEAAEHHRIFTVWKGFTDE